MQRWQDGWYISTTGGLCPRQAASSLDFLMGKSTHALSACQCLIFQTWLTQCWCTRNAVSYSDGPLERSTGRILFYLTAFDQTAVDLQVTPLGATDNSTYVARWYQQLCLQDPILCILLTQANPKATLSVCEAQLPGHCDRVDPEASDTVACAGPLLRACCSAKYEWSVSNWHSGSHMRQGDDSRRDPGSAR